MSTDSSSTGQDPLAQLRQWEGLALEGSVVGDICRLAIREIERLRALSTPPAPVALMTVSAEPCEWCAQGIALSADRLRHESDLGVWLCRRNESVSTRVYQPQMPPGEYEVYLKPLVGEPSVESKACTACGYEHPADDPGCPDT